MAYPESYPQQGGIDQAAEWQEYIRWLEAMIAQNQRDQSTMRTDTPDRAEYDPRQDLWNRKFYSQPQQPQQAPARQAPAQQGASGLVPQQRFTGQRAPGEEPITRESMIAAGRREKQERAAARQAARQKQQGDRALALMAMLSGSQVS